MNCDLILYNLCCCCIVYRTMNKSMSYGYEEHSRVILHFDIDCFYAQVEMVKNPCLANAPLGIQQKNIVVTSNYLAREYGVKKCMLISDAKKVCPNLTLVNGEDLHDYRQISYEVTKLLQTYSQLVERLGLDENFVDITNIVTERLQGDCQITKLIGNSFGSSTETCDCGCTTRLKMGTIIAQEIREAIYGKLKLTTCVGIATNKLLAKLVGSTHKPNQQTVIFPNDSLELMLSLEAVQNIPGIGVSLAQQLSDINVCSVSDLQSTAMTKLYALFGNEKATYIRNLSYGIDNACVKSSGKPQSIGIEDSCLPITNENDVRNKLNPLLHRLLVLVAEDGRIPKTIKLTIRKFDKRIKNTSRECRQCNINANLFNSTNIAQLSSASESKLMKVILELFKKVVDTKCPFSLTLLGLSFSNFTDPPNAKNSLKKFFAPKDVGLETSSTTHDNIQKNNSVITDHEDEHIAKKVKLTHTELEVNKGSVDNYQVIPKKSLVENNIPCPPNADEEVFRELPKELQMELWEEYRVREESDKVKIKSKKNQKPNSIMNYLVKK